MCQEFYEKSFLYDFRALIRIHVIQALYFGYSKESSREIKTNSINEEKQNKINLMIPCNFYGTTFR